MSPRTRPDAPLPPRRPTEAGGDAGGAAAEETPAGRDGRPTLKTIAYMTGLGVTTVSKALNDAPDIGQATKDRVRLVARRIGYRPNRAGVRLRTGRTNVISLILSTETEALGLSSHIIHGISERLAASPFHLIVTPYARSRDPLDAVRYIVETGSADGVIFSRTEPQDRRALYLHEAGVPFATHGRTELPFAHPFYDFDNAAYAELAVERLAARGRRTFALLPPPANLTCARHMAAGFVRGVERLDLTELPLHGVDVDTPPEALRAAVARLMSARRRPDALVCASAYAAILAISAAEDAGLVIGRDFDVAVKESFDLMRKFRPQILVVREDFRAAGVGLAAAALGAIAGRPAEELQTVETPRGAE